jgi:hypothetical protein
MKLDKEQTRRRCLPMYPIALLYFALLCVALHRVTWRRRGKDNLDCSMFALARASKQSS